MRVRERASAMARSERGGVRAASRGLLALGAAALTACGASPGPAAPKPMPTVIESPPDAAKEVTFSLADIEGKEVSSGTTRGRITIVASIATYDAASQAETRFLLEAARDHVPRINVVALVLEPLDNKPLVDAFASALKLPYPLCMASEETIRGEGPFAGMNQIPTVLILDKLGRERYRHVGLVQRAELEAALANVEGPKK